MSYLMRLADIEKEINGLNSKEVFARVREILKIRENPPVRISDKGVAYVDPIDIIASRRGGEIITHYAAEAKKKASLGNNHHNRK